MRKVTGYSQINKGFTVSGIRKLFKLSKLTKDTLLVAVVSLMSLGANLPESVINKYGINQRYLLIGLVTVLGFSLVRYLKFTLVLVIAILAVGANMPAELSKEIGVDSQVMLFALVGMVVTSFINFILKLPKGVKPLAQVNSLHGSRTLCHAASKGHASMVYSLLSAGINPNFRDERGQLPLVVAASNGHALVVKLLVDNGADVSARDAAGMSALDAANKAGFSQTALLLKNAELRSSGRGPAVTATASGAA